MTFDGLTVAAMADELRARLVGGRVQKIVQPDETAVALEIYAHHHRSWLLLAADPQKPRFHLADERLARGVELPTPLLLLLRKHVAGATLAAIDQVRQDRVLRLTYTTGRPNRAEPGDDGAHDALDRVDGTGEPLSDARPSAVVGFLIIEAIGRYSNIVLVGPDGIVLDALRRVSGDRNRARVTLPHHAYQPPPPQNKELLSAATTAACAELLSAVEPGATVASALVRRFAGLSPLAAREISHRAFGRAGDPIPSADAAESLARVLGEFARMEAEHDWSPSVGFSGDAMVAFAPYHLTHLDRWEAGESLSAAVDEFYRRDVGFTARDQARRDVRAAIVSERDRVERRHDSLVRALEGAGDAERFREYGELLLAFGQAAPRGADHLRCEGIDIPLDPSRSAIENAQAYFRRYHKMKAALRDVPAMIQATDLRLRFLDDLATWTEIADDPTTIRAMKSELGPARRQNGRHDERKAKRSRDGVLRLRLRDGTDLLVGRSALQNHRVTFDLANPTDIWLHARGQVGAHVILRALQMGGRDAEPAADALRTAAQIAAWFSGGRQEQHVTVDWTEKRYVRSVGAGAPGLVTYTHERSLSVTPASPAALGLV